MAAISYQPFSRTFPPIVTPEEDISLRNQ